MPRCSGCGNEIPSTARFCAICGKQSAGPVPSTSPRTGSSPAYVAPPADNSKMRVIAIAAGIVLLLAVAGFALKLSGVLGAKTPSTTSAAVLNAPTTQAVPAPVLGAPDVKAPTAPVIAPPVAAGTPMPDDVIAYLRWLKGFEAARHDLENRGEGQVKVVLVETMKNGMTGGANSGLLDGDASDAPAGGPPSAPKSAFDFHVIDQMVQQWNQVTGLFQQHTPPNPCAGLATSYSGALSESVRQMSALMGTLRSALAKLAGNNGQGTPDIMQTVSDLQSQQNSKSGSQSIDGLFSQANSDLDAIRSRYTNIPDDISAGQFSIKEQGSGGGGGGLGGMGLGF